MASHTPTSFQPTPPARTSTVDSQKSIDSFGGQISPTSSPASPTSRAFFGAITERLRERSRSRSRGDSSRKRAKSPTVMPPEHLSAQAPTTRYASQTHAPAKSRPALQQEQRRSTSSGSSSDPWRGRHSNQWIFGGFSVRETVKGHLERRKS